MKENLESDLLRVYVAVVECGGFSAAAERLHKTQSTISQRLQKLEAIVGTQLLIRTSRSLQLTAAGETFLDYARRILELHHEALQATNDSHRELSLEFGIPDDYAQNCLPPVLRAFQQRYPSVRPDVFCATSRELVAKVVRGELDAAVAVRHKDTGTGELVCEEELIWVASGNFELDISQPLPLALFPKGCVFRHSGLTALHTSELSYKVVYTSQSPRGLAIAIDDGLAIGISSRRLMKPEWQVIDDSRLPPIQSVELMLYRNETRESYKQAFYEMIKTQLRSASNYLLEESVLRLSVQ